MGLPRRTSRRADAEEEALLPVVRPTRVGTEAVLTVGRNADAAASRYAVADAGRRSCLGENAAQEAALPAVSASTLLPRVAPDSASSVEVIALDRLCADVVIVVALGPPLARCP